MKNKILLFTVVILASFSFAGDFGGYTIFEYNNTAFEINRVYFQYTDNLSDDLFLKIRYDVERESLNKDGKLETYLKNVYVDWKIKDLGKVSLGLIGTNSYDIQEENWGYRFIEKSPLDFRNSSILASVLIPLPDTPIFPTPSPDGITHAKNSGYFS